MNIKILTNSVIEIAQKAGDIILDIYHNASDIEIEKKGDDSPLTLADWKANAYICEQLEQLDPKLPIISEENKTIPYEERKDYEYYWLVDPLDGTKEFIKRNGEFTVNIALIKRHKPVMGVVYAPVLEETYWGIIGEGAYLKKDKHTKAIEAPFYSKDQVGLYFVASRSHLNEETVNYISQFKEPNKVSKGSSLKFLMIASGEAHIYPRMAPTMEWDTGAAQAVLEAAGGKVVQADTLQPLAYNKENLLNPFFIAMGKEV